jgi:hypothetical protein
MNLRPIPTQAPLIRCALAAAAAMDRLRQPKPEKRA